jgi:hypothetical protein
VHGEPPFGLRGADAGWRIGAGIRVKIAYMIVAGIFLPISYSFASAAMRIGCLIFEQSMANDGQLIHLQHLAN